MDKYFKSNAFTTFEQSKKAKKKCRKTIIFLSIPSIILGILLNDIIFSATFVLMLIGIFSLLISIVILFLESHSNNEKGISTWNDNYFIAFRDKDVLISRPYCAGIENGADSMKYNNEKGLLIAKINIPYDQIKEIELEEREFGSLEYGIWKARILNLKLYDSRSYHVYPTHFSSTMMDFIEKLFGAKLQYHISRDYLNQFYGKDKVSPLKKLL
ncbi:MAG: hypothetical protein EWM50_04115 [Gottschalkiaceae bacterium]|nr:MAG: hypothetical protein EWM50_04115 [Gottschalkiaceae bacterium]